MITDSKIADVGKFIFPTINLFYAILILVSLPEPSGIVRKTKKSPARWGLYAVHLKELIINDDFFGDVVLLSSISCCDKLDKN